jgi:hypothetical protein
MPANKKTRRTPSGKSKKESPSLSLKIESADRAHPHVDADEFLTTAEKWLNALKVFAAELGEHVKWEIVDLRKGSALIQVQPVKVKTHKPATALVKKWDEGTRKIEKTGRPAPKFTAESLAAFKDFVLSVPKDAIVSVGNGLARDRRPVTAWTQRRVEEAARRLPREQNREYETKGSIRGRLAVLDSWNPEERSFLLQLPLAPSKAEAVKCVYREGSLVSELGENFEGAVEISGQLHYRPDRPWPYAVDVEHIRVLRPPVVGLRDLVGLLHLPAGQDSVSYVRSVRDAE